MYSKAENNLKFVLGEWPYLKQCSDMPFSELLELRGVIQDYMQRRESIPVSIDSVGMKTSEGSNAHTLNN